MKNSSDLLTVMKFGGTSVQDAPAIKQSVDIVQSRQGQRLVVVSALAKVTDQLVCLAEYCKNGDLQKAQSSLENLLHRHLEVASELSLPSTVGARLEALFQELQNFVVEASTRQEAGSQAMDFILSFGELCSSHLVAGALEKTGFPSRWADSREWVVTNSEFSCAQLNVELTNKNLTEQLKPLLQNYIVVVQGFIGRDLRGHTTTLGRGGSDYSAALYGAGLQAHKVEIWTDVDGILSTDPRVVPEASTLRRIHFLEAAEMAYFGAKVIHPKTIYPALAEKISVWILNSKKPLDPGTEITFDENYRSVGVCGIAFKKDITLVNIYSTRMLGAHGFLKTVFDVFARHKISVDLIATSEVNISLTLDPHFDPQAFQEVRQELKEFSEVEVHTGRGMISVVGGGVRTTSGLALKIFSEIKGINIQMISMGASELNLSFVVNSDQVNEVVLKLHRALIQSST